MSSVAEKLGRNKSREKPPLTKEEKKRRQRKGLIKGLVILTIAIVGSWGLYEGIKVAAGTQYPVVVVVSPSMEPNIHTGDLLFVHYVPPVDIKNGTIEDLEGDVILYDANGLWPSGAPADPIVHRVVGKRFDVAMQKYYFITKGDNNDDTDPPGTGEIEVPEDHVLGVVWGGIPYIGYVKIALTTGNIAIPLMVIIGILLVATIVWDTLHPEEEEDGKEKKSSKKRGKPDNEMKSRLEIPELEKKPSAIPPAPEAGGTAAEPSPVKKDDIDFT